jgi:hypothetical protein
LGFNVSGKVAPETVNPLPLTVAEFTVTAAVPVEVSVTVCATAVFTASLPKLKFVALKPRVDTYAPSDKEKIFELFAVEAVSVAAWAVFTAVTVAAKLALVAPAATVTDAGTVTAELLLLRFTANPPVGAAPLKFAVQLSVPEPVIDPLAQLKPFSTGTEEASM